MTGLEGGQAEINKIDQVKRKQRRPEEVISQYHNELREWSKNVDKRYAWVILAALFFTFAATLGSYRIYGLVFAKVTTSGEFTREEASWPVSMIFTSENLVGPLVSVIAYHISYRNSMLVGGILIVLCNGLSYLSSSLVLDVILIGVIQGIGYAFIFMPFMEVINSYFLRYRNMALGFSLCGGTVAVFALSPLFQWILETYHWRVAYLAIGLLACVNILMVPLLKPNPKPQRMDAPQMQGGMSFRSLTYQNSMRRQSFIVVRPDSLMRHGSVISVNPFASSVGLERKISRARAHNDSIGGLAPGQERGPHQAFAGIAKQSTTPSKEDLISLSEVKSLSEIEQETADKSFDMKVILDILKTPGFHVIWYLELAYFWIFSIYCLVLVDFGIDRGCTMEEAERLLMFQSIGEVVGRLGLTVLVDMQFLSCQNVVILDLILLAGILCSISYVNGFIWMASLTVVINSLASLLYILLNGLLVEKLGERKVTIGYGMASSVVGVLIVFRPQAVGFFRDDLGSYEWLMISLGLSCVLGAALCVLENIYTRCCGKKRSSIDGSSA